MVINIPKKTWLLLIYYNKILINFRKGYSIILQSLTVPSTFFVRVN